MDTTVFYLMLSGLLFAIGIYGAIVRRDAIAIFMSIELMLNAVNLTFVACAKHFSLLRQVPVVDGQIAVFFVMAIAAAEAAVGLAIVLGVFRNNFSVEADGAVLLNETY